MSASMNRNIMIIRSFCVSSVPNLSCKNASKSPGIFARIIPLFNSIRNVAMQSKYACKPSFKPVYQSRKQMTIVGVVAVSVASYIGWVKVSNKARILADSAQIPIIKATKQVRVSTDSSGLKLTLFQYQTCPFCCKARTLLDYYGFSYDVVEVHSVRRKQMSWTPVKKLPMLIFHGVGDEGYVKVHESNVIMSLLESYLLDPSQSVDKLASFYPPIETEGKRGKPSFEFPNKYYVMYQGAKPDSTEDQQKKQREWRQWVDDVLLHTLTPNVYRTPREAVQAFKHHDQVGQWQDVLASAERPFIIYGGAFLFYVLGKMIKRKYKLKTDVRESMYDACKEWIQGLGKAEYMGGDSPNLADLSAYGILSSIEGSDAFDDLMQNTMIGVWYYRMKTAVTQHDGAHPLHRKS